MAHKLMRRTGFILLLLFGLLPELALLGFFTAGALLSCPAELPRHADVVVVLGGSGDGARYARGLELVQAGFSERLVLIVPNAKERKDALAKLRGVEFWDDVLPANSWGEAEAARARMQAKGWHSVLVVSDPPHLLRLRYTWGSIFRGTDLTYTLIASDPPWWSVWRWWQNPQSAGFVDSEVFKLGYYVLHYRFGF